MTREPPVIRRLTSNGALEADSWKAIREICRRTGDNGRPIAAERWDFFPRIWIDPYERLVPQWSYVAEADAVVGYLTGCPDTVKFSRKRFFRCTVPLLLEIARGRLRESRDACRFVRQALGIERKAESRFPRAVRRSIERDYPAHLHVNVEAAFRGRGIGKQLMAAYVSDLQTSGVPGVHLYCGPDPLPFYLKLDFQKVSSIEIRGAAIHALGRSWPMPPDAGRATASRP
jgi:GNAT superfamily N-acetyltransferase